MPKLDEVKAEQARRSLSVFIREGWHVLEPTTPLIWNWHMDAVALHVQAALEDWITVQGWLSRENTRSLERPDEEPEAPFVQRIRNLLINIVPGSAKSRIISVYTPAWMWVRCPEWRAIFLSANPRVALRDSIFCREVIESDWYQQWFQPDWKLTTDQNAKGLFRNTRGGFRQALGFLAKITGDRGDALFIDDPNDPEEANSDTIRKSVNDRWSSTVYNRVNDLRTSLRIGIQQRVHEEDWSGHILKEGNWEHLCCPMEYEPQRLDADVDRIPRVTSIGWSDPRTTEGELLFPERFPKEVVEFEKIRLGSYGYAGQHQQRPSPAEGGILKRHWWRFWQPAGLPRPLPPVQVRLADGSTFECPVIDLPESLEQLIQSWDMTFKDTKDSAFVVGQVWGKIKADRFLLDQVRDKLNFPATVKAVRDLTTKWPRSYTKLVEDKANGPAVISTLEHEISGLIGVEPDGDKIARVHAVSPQIESGNVYLPHPALYSWVDGLIGEASTFPNSAYADQVDTLSQALRRFDSVGSFSQKPIRR